MESIEEHKKRMGMEIGDKTGDVIVNVRFTSEEWSEIGVTSKYYNNMTFKEIVYDSLVLKNHILQDNKILRYINYYGTEFKDKYLTPNDDIIEDYLYTNDEFEIIKNHKYLSKQSIKQYLNSLPYKEFLRTRYWKIIRNIIIRRDGHNCMLCCNGNDLQVHHKRYFNKGVEYEHLDELITLCSDCHKKFHNIPNNHKGRTVKKSE